MQQPMFETTRIVQALDMTLTYRKSGGQIDVVLYRLIDGHTVAWFDSLNGKGSHVVFPQYLAVPVWLHDKVLAIDPNVTEWAAFTVACDQIEVWTDLGPECEGKGSGPLTSNYREAARKCGVLLVDAGLVVTVHG